MLLEDKVRYVKINKLLDVGGTISFWKKFSNFAISKVNITTVNTKKEQEWNNVKSHVGDAANMREFADNSFDLVFSNSVIEHVGDFSRQKNMADEVQRIGKNYFLQTPNKYFFMEPHFLFPFFQLLPTSLKIFLIQHFNLGNYKKIKDYNEAKRAVEAIRLLSKRELKALFHDANIYEEKFFCFTKSFIVSNL